MTDPHGCTINGQPAMPILISEYNRLTTELAGLRAVARGYCPACGRGDAAPTVQHWEAERAARDSYRRAWQAERGRRAPAEAAITRVRAIAEQIRAGAPWTANLDNIADRLHDALDQPAAARMAGLIRAQADEITSICPDHGTADQRVGACRCHFAQAERERADRMEGR